MRFTISWLKEYLDTDEDLSLIGERLTSIGLEVESIKDQGSELAPFIVAYIEEAIQHPNADRLKLCKVNTGESIIQVVCGAPNARAGMKGVFAHSGLTIPGTGLRLKKTKIRGVESNGMLCSELEMGISADHEGIIELPDDAPVGLSFSDFANKKDAIIDIAITPNRADCLGVLGIARDLAASGIGKIILPAIEKINGNFKSPISVDLQSPSSEEAICSLFLSRYIKGVKNVESPSWLQERLEAIGLRPISAVVDITNYLTFDCNRPVHAFDADQIKGNNLQVKLDSGDTSFKALNDKSYILDNQMTVISDSEGAVSLAGVIGGERTACTEETVNVFLEVALFDPVRTASTGRKLGIDSDARYRFERGVDPAFAENGMELATKMLIDLCGGEPSHVSVTGSLPIWQTKINFNSSKVKDLGGVSIPESKIKEILEDLGCKYEGSGETAVVVPPSWRGDIVGEADLVEEVLRIYGYDKIPAVSITETNLKNNTILPIKDRRAGWIRRSLATRGLMEAVTYSFMSGQLAHRFTSKDALVLNNPISSELDTMRPSLLPNLIHALSRNIDRGHGDIGIFEIGPQFEGNLPEDQRDMATGVRVGCFEGRNWHEEIRQVDIFDAKADILVALEAANTPVDKLQIYDTAPKWYHPGRSGEFRLGKNVLGWFGEIHPEILSILDLNSSCVGFECFIDKIPVPKSISKTTRPPLNASDLQLVERDFAFIVDEDVLANDLIRTVWSAEKKLISGVSIFDIYVGKGIETGKKSIAISVQLQPTNTTLTDEEIDSVSSQIVDKVAKQVGGVLRS